MSRRWTDREYMAELGISSAEQDRRRRILAARDDRLRAEYRRQAEMREAWEHPTNDEEWAREEGISEEERDRRRERINAKWDLHAELTAPDYAMSQDAREGAEHLRELMQPFALESVASTAPTFFTLFDGSASFRLDIIDAIHWIREEGKLVGATAYLHPLRESMERELSAEDARLLWLLVTGGDD